MTIVAVNGGGNTPQGYPLDRCFIKSWSTSGDADDRPTEGYSSSFVFTDYKPTESLSTDGTPGEDVMCQNNLWIGDDFIIDDGDNNSIIIVNSLAEDHQSNPNETVVQGVDLLV